MAIVGFYSTHPDEKRKDNGTKFVENFSQTYKLTSMTYIGPAVMGVGGFIIVATCVLVFEARDTAARVIPLWLWPTHDQGSLAVGSHATKNTTSWEVFHAQPQSVTETSTDSFGFINPLKVSSGGAQKHVLDHLVYRCLSRSPANWPNGKKANFQRLQMFHLTTSDRENPKGQCLGVAAIKNTESDYLRAQFRSRSKVRYQYGTGTKLRSCDVETSPRKSTSEPNINEFFQSTDVVWVDENEIFDNKSSILAEKMTLHPVNHRQHCLCNVPPPILNVHGSHEVDKVSNETVPIVSKRSNRFDFYNTFQETSIIDGALSRQMCRSKAASRKRSRSKTHREKRSERKRKHQSCKSADRNHSRDLWSSKSPISSCREDSGSQSTSTEYLLPRRKNTSTLYGSLLKRFSKKS
ncbi:uncharacterized protein LOC111083750 [Limulus polyphemus]|uniref:Uncharacterized protein LOC111083750 n=1 Tax=Limulus polyphemus TaxID=6850 RepID=A0ABM1RXM5_LIMPO|nr:uncharacterized protein LOC111083750 [Limulus polyphemus]